jgi:hypothetical protein
VPGSCRPDVQLCAGPRAVHPQASDGTSRSARYEPQLFAPDKNMLDLDRLDEHRTARRLVRRLDAPSRDAMLRPRPRVDLAMPRRPPAPGPPPWIFGPAPISPHLRAFRQPIPATTCHTAGRPRAWASSCRARGNR